MMNVSDRILVVEDDPSVRTTIVTFLELEGYQVEAVNKASGTEMTVLRYPSVAGSADQRKAWYKASMLRDPVSQAENEIILQITHVVNTSR